MFLPLGEQVRFLFQANSERTATLWQKVVSLRSLPAVRFVRHHCSPSGQSAFEIHSGRGKSDSVHSGFIQAAPRTASGLPKGLPSDPLSSNVHQAWLLPR